jgi:hypothetical protein
MSISAISSAENNSVRNSPHSSAIGTYAFRLLIDFIPFDVIPHVFMCLSDFPRRRLFCLLHETVKDDKTFVMPFKEKKAIAQRP